jgi:8-oxo-dGTP diphosphatase
MVYDSKMFDISRPNVGVTVVPFLYESGVLKTLVYLRSNDSEVFPGKYCLPNMFYDIQIHNNLEEAATESLKIKTNVSIPYLEQLNTFSGQYIDPERINTLNISYFALASNSSIKEESESGLKSKWVEVNDVISNYELAFNHNEVLEFAFSRIKSKSEYTSIACNMLSEKFTIKDFREITELLISEKLDNSRFRDRIKKTDILIECPNEYTKGANRPAQLYSMNKSFEGCFYPKSLTKPR